MNKEPDVLELAGLGAMECTCPVKWPYGGICPWCMSPIGALAGLAIGVLWLLFTLPADCKDCPDCGRWSNRWNVKSRHFPHKTHCRLGKRWREMRKKKAAQKT